MRQTLFCHILKNKNNILWLKLDAGRFSDLIDMHIKFHKKRSSFFGGVGNKQRDTKILYIR